MIAFHQESFFGYMIKITEWKDGGLVIRAIRLVETGENF